MDLGHYEVKLFGGYDERVPLFLQYVFEAIVMAKINGNLCGEKVFEILNKNEENYLEEKDKKEMEEIIKEVNQYHWVKLSECINLNVLSALLFLWLRKSINFVIDWEILKGVGEDFKEYAAEMKNCEVHTLRLVCKFLKNIEEKETEAKNSFSKKLCKELLGNKNFEGKEVISSKLFKLIIHMSNESK